MAFDFWQRWGRELGDADFARAWTALGVAAGSEVKHPSSEGYVGLLERNPQAAPSDTYLEIARTALADALLASREHGRRVRWSFPTATSTVDADGRFPLTRIDPAAWAGAWTDAVGIVNVRPRLRVTDAPESDAIAPWIRLLSEAQPQPDAVSLALPAPDATLAVEWPVRFGTLPQNIAGAIMAVTLGEWPSSRLARSVPIDRDNANCDVLLHVGSAASLLRALRAQPFRCKANIVALAGAIDADPVALGKQLRAIATRTCASGIVLQSSADDLRELGYGWNRFVEEMSHNVTIDRALHVAARSHPAGDAVIWLTDDLANLMLRSLADRLTARVRALPAGSAIDISRLNVGWVTSANPLTRGGTRGGGATIELARADAASIRFDAGRLSFDAESHGASELAILSRAVDEAVEPSDAEARARGQVLATAVVRQTRPRVRRSGAWIPAGTSGARPRAHRWAGGEMAIARESVPGRSAAAGAETMASHGVAYRPSQLRKPLRSTLVLPSEGPSTPCDFRFTPLEAGRFEGRLTVLHRGRVVQTAVLRAGVTAAEIAPMRNPRPCWARSFPSATGWAISSAGAVHLAYVTNHTVTGEPGGVALAADRAWIADVSKSLEVTKDINTALSRVTKSVADYADGLDGAAGRALLVELAQQGAWLQLYLVRKQLQNSRNRPDVAEREYIQIVSTRTDAMVPFEFIYDYAVPDKDAALCPRWHEGVGQGKCLSTCNANDQKNVCPMGFWGLRKVIERHQFSPEHSTQGKDVFLQSEPGRETTDLSLGRIGVARKQHAALRVPRWTTVKDALKAKLGAAPQTASSWAEWTTIVDQREAAFLLALPHADGIGATVTLEDQRRYPQHDPDRRLVTCGPAMRQAARSSRCSGATLPAPPATMASTSSCFASTVLRSSSGPSPRCSASTRRARRCCSPMCWFPTAAAAAGRRGDTRAQASRSARRIADAAVRRRVRRCRLASHPIGGRQ